MELLPIVVAGFLWGAAWRKREEKKTHTKTKKV